MGNIKIAEPEIGRRVIVCLVYTDDQEQITRSEQYYGSISRVTRHNVFISTSTGKEIRILSTYFMYAPGGAYKLRSSGEIVRNPDMIASWSVNPANSSRTYEEWEPNLMPLCGTARVPAQFDWKYWPDVNRIARLIQERRELYIGKTVIIGLHHYLQSDPESRIVRHEQLFGTIEAIAFTTTEGKVRVRLHDGRTYSLPPDITLLQPLADDSYELCDMNDSVENPDFYIKLYVRHTTEDDLGVLETGAYELK